MQLVPCKEFLWGFSEEESERDRGKMDIPVAPSNEPVLYEALSTYDWTRSMQLMSQDAGLLYTHMGWTPLHVACERGAPLQVLHVLVEKGLSVNQSNHLLCTPLHIAVSCRKASLRWLTDIVSSRPKRVVPYRQ